MRDVAAVLTGPADDSAEVHGRMLRWKSWRDWRKCCCHKAFIAHGMVRCKLDQQTVEK